MRLVWMALVSALGLTACSSDKGGEDEDVLAESDESDDDESPKEESDGEGEDETGESEEPTASAETPPAEAPQAGGGSDFDAMLKSMGAAPAAPAPAAATAATPTAAQGAPIAAAPQAAKVGKSTATGKAASLSGKTRRLKSSVLAVREGPSLDAKIVGYLHGDVTVKAVAEGWKGWTQIGPKRFVRTKYLTKGGAKTVGSGQDFYVVKSEALYIRNSPSLEAEVVGVLTGGDKVRAAPASGGWVQLGPRRYVRVKYLEAVGH